MLRADGQGRALGRPSAGPLARPLAGKTRPTQPRGRPYLWPNKGDRSPGLVLVRLGLGPLQTRAHDQPHATDCDSQRSFSCCQSANYELQPCGSDKGAQKTVLKAALPSHRRSARSTAAGSSTAGPWRSGVQGGVAAVGTEPQGSQCCTFRIPPPVPRTPENPIYKENMSQKNGKQIF